MDFPQHKLNVTHPYPPAKGSMAKLLPRGEGDGEKSSVAKLLPRMRDPDYTKILIVALPELTPILEAIELEKDLKRAGISSHAWVINQSLAPLAVSDPLLKAKQREELPYIDKLIEAKGSRVFIAGWDLRLSEESR